MQLELSLRLRTERNIVQRRKLADIKRAAIEAEEWQEKQGIQKREAEHKRLCLKFFEEKL